MKKNEYFTDTSLGPLELTSGSWEHLESTCIRSSKDRSTKDQGDDFEWIVLHYLRNEPIHNTRFKNVWFWRDWPQRAEMGYDLQDLGIDLVADLGNSKYCAVQAKGYSYLTTIGLDAFAKPVSQAARNSCFTECLIVTSTNDVSRNLQESLRSIDGNLNRNIQHFTLIQRQHLLDSDLSKNLLWPGSVENIKKGFFHYRSLPRDVRPHQKDALQDSLFALIDQSQDRIQVLMPCGSGKTLVSQRIVEGLSAKRVLVMVPSLDLLKQILSSWHRDKLIDFQFKVICSDGQTVNSINNGRNEESDSFITNVESLGVPVAVNPEDIALFLRTSELDDKCLPRYIFSTYQSSEVIEEAMQLPDVPDFNVVCCDEAHNLATVSHDGEQKAFTAILSNFRIRAQKRVFLTATPKIFSRRLKDKASQMESLVTSMDDPTTFGRVAHRLTYKTAVERGVLSDYKVIVMSVLSKDVINWIESKKAEYVRAGGVSPDIPVEDAMTQISLLKSMKKYGIKRAITYHSTIARADVFATGKVDGIAIRPSLMDMAKSLTLTEDGSEKTMSLKSLHINGKMTSAKRTSVLQELRNSGNDKTVVVSNVGCLGEGIDVDILDAVFFADARQSSIDIGQIIGRVMRLDPNNALKKGFVVLPVLVDEGEDTDKIFSNSTFDKVWQIVCALRSLDDDFAQLVDLLNTTKNSPQNGVDKNESERRRIILECEGKIKQKIHFDVDNISLDEITLFRLNKKFTAKVLDESHFSSRNSDFDFENIKKHAQDFYNKWDKFPGVNEKDLDGLPLRIANTQTSWASINQRLKKLGLGTLHHWLAKHFPQHPGNIVTDAEVLKVHAIKYFQKHGRFPSTSKDKLNKYHSIGDGPDTWSAFEQRLRKTQKSSLARWIAFNFPDIKKPPVDDLVVLRNYAEKFHIEHGTYPTPVSRKAPGMTYQIGDTRDTWLSIDRKLNKLGETGLVKWLAKEFPDHPENIGLVRDIEHLKKCVLTYREKFGKFPSVNSLDECGRALKIEGTADTWANINNRLKRDYQVTLFQWINDTFSNDQKSIVSDLVVMKRYAEQFFIEYGVYPHHRLKNSNGAPLRIGDTMDTWLAADHRFRWLLNKKGLSVWLKETFHDYKAPLKKIVLSKIN
jgi:superfamily II DNA or RNA helicase